MNLRLIAIHTGVETYLDHIGVLAALLEIPLIVTEPKTYAAALEFYPKAEVILKDPLELSLAWLSSHYDGIVESGHWWATELLAAFETFCHKRMRIIYCPHGNSHKGYGEKNGPLKDISLVYGNQMQQLLLSQEEKSQQIVVGNFRLEFYKDHHHFYDQKIDEKLRLAPFDPKKKTLLYAPTWYSKKEAEIFFKQADILLTSLCTSFNVIIKLHPFLEEWLPGETIYFMGHQEKKEGLFFLDNFPPIYPLLNRCDGYVGDFSSIGYDFLAFDRPIFLTMDEKGPLQQCSQQIPLLQEAGTFLKNEWEFNQTALRKKRKETYDDAFAAHCVTKELLSEIKNLNF